ncbi:MAG: hypothetical protein HOP12_10340 [Candidatus Eisenbacteria bacterium]|uniref:Histidine phosphatase family protein n=1 Tax=Eiseniibacteriota bacterium TaxID=2212470 RepID=A0A849SIW6_UNCEI|nr:hypothetical protein [Candidatus Eisenbacteria bacterium]
MSRQSIVVFATVVLLIAAGLYSSARAQSAMAPMASTPRDTTRQGYHYLHLIRHGWYDYTDNRDDRVGRGLDSLGREQARLVGERFAKLPIPIHSLVSSTFTRAMNTADLMGEIMHVRALRDSNLSECSARANRADYNRNAEPGEVDSCEARLARAWATYVRPVVGREDRHDVLVCHGNVIRWFAEHALGMKSGDWPAFEIGNGSITTIVVRPDGSTRLATFSDTGHLPPAAQTWTGRGAGWSPPPPMRPAASRAGIAAPAPAAAFDTLRTGGAPKQ